MKWQQRNMAMVPGDLKFSIGGVLHCIGLCYREITRSAGERPWRMVSGELRPNPLGRPFWWITFEVGYELD